MPHLIKKNLSIHKYQWFLYVGLLVFFLFFNKDVIFIVSLVSAIIIMNEFYFDEKANGDKLWNSLPFTRKEIVGARYISLLIATLFCTSFVILVEFFGGAVGTPEFWKQVLGSIMLIMSSAAICFPIFFCLKKRTIIFALFVLYILLVIGGSYLFYYSYLYIRKALILSGQLTDEAFFSIAMICTTVLYLISLGVSIKLYRQRDII